MELLHLATHLTKVCRQKGLDYQVFDLKASLDATLSYEENLAVIDQALGVSEHDYMNMVAQEAESEFKSLQSLEEENRRLEQQHKKDLARMRRLEQQIKQPQPTPQPQPLEQPVASKQVEYDPLNAPYSEAELAEITSYLQTRQHIQNVKQKDYPKPAKTLTPIESKILVVSTKVARKTWSFAKWVLI